ncbi:MAG TPA: hypothetical protein PLX12_11135, partial [Flexilinea sp.]|nr:hypothetical protein [Flexilinea sp.]
MSNLFILQKLFHIFLTPDLVIIKKRHQQNRWERMKKKINSPQYDGKKQRLIFLISIFILCIAALWLYLYTTPNGVGLTNDSAAYLGGARSILRGEGYVR